MQDNGNDYILWYRRFSTEDYADALDNGALRSAEWKLMGCGTLTELNLLLMGYGFETYTAEAEDASAMPRRITNRWGDDEVTQLWLQPYGLDKLPPTRCSFPDDHPAWSEQ
jgi:hypothetical protein